MIQLSVVNLIQISRGTAYDNQVHVTQLTDLFDQLSQKPLNLRK